MPSMVHVPKQARTKIARQMTQVNFSHKLSRPIQRYHGTMATLESLADAARLIAELESFHSRPIWTKVASQILRAAATGKKADIDGAMRMLEMALRTEKLLY